ncbi:hypothetical protein GCM10010452_86670 [Crossiella cryophila]
MELLVKTPSDLRLLPVSTVRVIERGKRVTAVRDDGVFGTLLGPERTRVSGLLLRKQKIQFYC